MQRWVIVAIATAFFGMGAPASAQQETLPNTHPVPIVEGQNATPVAPPGATSPSDVAARAEVQPSSSGPLQPGPPAGDERAQYLSNGALIAGGVAITAAIVCTLACFSTSSSTTTSTTVVHR